MRIRCGIKLKVLKGVVMEKAEQSSFCKLSFQLPLDSFLLDIHFSSNKKRIGILGASGSGKSMCLKSIAGIVTPKQGEILLGDSCLFSSSKKINLPPQKRRIGYLFQSYALFPHLTVWDNIAIAMQGKENKESKSEQIFALLRKMELSGLEKRFPAELSGGQQQRVALARIFANEPKMILLDEPFSALDLYLRDKMQEELMLHLEDFPGQAIMVSHSRDEIYRFAEEVIMLQEGKVIGQGETKEVFRQPKNRQAAILTGCKNIAKAKKIGKHSIFIEDWGLELTMKQEIPEKLSAVGYRAHDFIPLFSGGEENAVSVKLLSKAELPFEQNFYFKPEKGEGEICFLVQRDGPYGKMQEIPKALQLREEKLLLLMEEQ
ncbi:ABC transporter, ATP-binding protein [Oribacterium sinus F0268]|uniref:ABC transporter, ATP-binding protein n=3 Tax=Oribacterium sinus TaxID=237576 RepID=C2L0U1_9FIRM|nr:ABC transporter, ATP-binding protein [Oribacterium sinus F0268]